MGTVYCCREVLPAMEKLGGGTVTIIGATAAFRGGNGFSGFAVSKFGQRALSQSIAREYGPKGVHVSHVNIDGVIDSARSRGRRGEQPDEFFLQPGDIAEAVWYLVQQPRSAWTQELDLRPHVEKW
jgi:NADP-dependent 3-hydroxy acid dehydrogenase YdfG